MNFVGSNVGSGRKSASAVIRLKSMHKVVVVVNCIVIFDKKLVGGDALLYERIIFIIKAYEENLLKTSYLCGQPLERGH